jgi:hypothetical protein
MAFSPLGVAMGVSGDAHLQSGAQPIGQTPASLGARQRGPSSIGPCGSQKSSPTPQHASPQQTASAPHVVVQGGVTQAPAVQ